MSLHHLGEFGLIRHLSQTLGVRPGVRLGIGDDAALLDALATPVVTCDCLVEGVHFRRDWTTPFLLGRKALNVNLSDIAAMGGRPIAAFITLAVGEGTELSWLEELYRGLESAALDANCTLAGGDTSRAPQTVLSITLIGDAPQPVLRSGARPGDIVVATGTLGDAAAGLALLQRDGPRLTGANAEFALQRHFDPTPRLREMAAALEVRTPNDLPAVCAALDLSDGLAGDARHIAARSGVSLEIEVARLPISPATREVAAHLGASAEEWALRGGEDYELLLCVAPESAPAVVETITAVTGTLVTLIGRCLERESSPVILLRPDGSREAAPGAWEHF